MKSDMPLLRVIRASAGSGKTFNLTLEYLRLLFAESDSFLHILAVTFTNKATEEMKSRILSELFLLSSGQPSGQLAGLAETTGLNEKQIRTKALVILKKILHRYSGFSVTTIDSFFQRIIRGFTRELGIQEGYSIELDTEVVLEEAIDRLLLQAENDKVLLSWLTQFAEYLIEKGESWNIRNGISDLGGEIFREEFKSLNDTSLKTFSDKEVLTHYRTHLHSIISSAEKHFKDSGVKAEKIIQSCNLTVSDFCNKNRGPAGFLLKLKTAGFTEPTATAREAVTCADKWHTASSPNKHAIQKAAAELIPIMQEVIDYYDEQARYYFTSKVILKNLYTLGILIDLSNLADTWCAENNTFLLPEAPVFLNRIIDGNDTPFIYEKAGCWYHHFMIDEFQDTSEMQWLNFKPLISNSLSQNFQNLAVGDSKQSIYRWRNSNWDILQTRVKSEFSDDVIEEITLKENWRSGKTIIEFNNHFFSEAAGILQKYFEQEMEGSGFNRNLSSIDSLYDGLLQKPGKPGSPGYVQIDHIEETGEDSYNDTVNQFTVNLIHELTRKGYHYRDIAVLTRKNSEARDLTDYILMNSGNNGEPAIRVISDEALQLGSSVVVNTIIAVFHYLSDPTEKTNRYYLGSLLQNYTASDVQSEQWIIPDEISTLKWLSAEELSHKESVYSQSLVELTEKIIKTLGLEKHSGERAYLMAFRDIIIDYSSKKGSDLVRFLEYWNEKGYKNSVSAPSEQDAVRIMTLHKAKGLEFAVTIIPYCNWELNSFNKSFLWCQPEVEPFNRLPLLPLNFTKELKNTIFEQDYFEEIHNQLIDNLNLLYVAFTRAKEALYICCKPCETEQMKTVSDLVRKIAGNKNFKTGELKGYESSDKQERSKEIDDIPKAPVSEIQTRIKIAFQGDLLIDPEVKKPFRPLNEGKILHDIFKQINIREDIITAVNKLHMQGTIASDEIQKYIQLIQHAMNDIQVAGWFSGDWHIMNEAEIILPEGKTKRPDRVMIKNNQTLIIDYKFGMKTDAVYETQLREYASLLKSMGYSHIESYIWYVKLGKIITVN
ncbi:MAG TPA: UvrD-helicase domain-containing protein [Bacteroidales bacterium]|nr:UvrD-helicase domain-containing protein [Bacteroidales bacterium]